MTEEGRAVVECGCASPEAPGSSARGSLRSSSREATPSTPPCGTPVRELVRVMVAHSSPRREIRQKAKGAEADRRWPSLVCGCLVRKSLGFVAGDTVLGRTPKTLEHAASPVSRNEASFGFLRLVQRLLGSEPLVHVDDVCDALVFCMERPSIAGRFLCAAAYPTIHDVVDHYANKLPHLDILKETDAVARVQPDGKRLGELGFRYKYGMEEILDCSVDCAVRLGSLDAAKLSVQEG